MSDYITDYNSPEERKKRMLQEDPIIMYLVVRKSLGMSMGKTAAQAGHAVGMLHIKQAEYAAEDKKSLFPEFQEKLKIWDEWVHNSFRKVVLGADDKQWQKLKDKIPDAVVVVDSGLTEIAYGSETVIGIWPMCKSNAPQVIKKLQALK
jgi:peptidyl-tRNA hydrolase